MNAIALELIMQIVLNVLILTANAMKKDNMYLILIVLCVAYFIIRTIVG